MSTVSTLNMASRSFLAALCFLLLAQQKEAMGDVFADFTAIDFNAETAMGQLNGVDFTLESTREVPTGYGTNGGVEDLAGYWTLDGTSTVFDSAVFTPSLAMGDAVALGASSDFRITFAHPVTDLTLHIFELAFTRLDFTSNGTPAQFSLLSSNGFFTVLDGGTAIVGTNWDPWGNDNASGSLLFSGTFSELSWTSSWHPGDAISLQMSVVPEPSTLALLSMGAIAGLYLWRRRRRAM